MLASAGTGKTRVLTERVRHTLNNTKKEGIIALTFTNKSAEEMKTRLEDSDSTTDRCWIATIHSVAQRIVEQYGHTIGLPSNLNIYDRDQDRKTIFLQSLANNGFSIEDLNHTGFLKGTALGGFSSYKVDKKLNSNKTSINIGFPNQWPEELSLTPLVELLDRSSIPFVDLIKNTLIGIESLDIENPNMLKLFSRINEDIKKEVNLLKNNHFTTKKPAEKQWESLLQELEMFKKDMDEFKKYWRLFRLKKSEPSLLAFKNALSLGELIPTDTESRHAPALTLSTVHTMKGLEKDIVFLMGMCEGVFPDYRAKSQHEIEEEKNNAFVAVTRSRRWIYITYPKKREMPWGDIKSQQESRFVTAMKNNSLSQTTTTLRKSI